MTTLASAELDSSDESDDDYAPRSPKAKLGKRTSVSSSTEDQVDEVEAKRLKLDAEDERRRLAAQMFSILREETNAGPSRVVSGDTRASGEEMVEVRRPRRFAGETI